MFENVQLDQPKREVYMFKKEITPMTAYVEEQVGSEIKYRYC
jgi:hypothetical protein|tara:strand:- start:72 stop:197 length:126 start_codon:yes stop_codon:yes gene_type:complete